MTEQSNVTEAQLARGVAAISTCRFHDTSDEKMAAEVYRAMTTAAPEKEIVGNLYDAAFKARWFVNEVAHGGIFTEIGRANAKGVLALLDTALETARKQG